MSEFSRGQTRIANFILDSYDKAAFMTAGKMGAVTGVSESTVVRFAADLGYDGYPAMQRALQELLRNKLTAVQRIEAGKERIGNQDILSVVLQQDADQLRETMECTDHAAFARAVDAILAARRIYILGVRSSATLASFLHLYFQYMFDNVCLVNAASPSETFEQLARTTQEDVLITISYPRYSHTAVRAAEHCKSAGARIVAITDSARAPVAAFADDLLLAKMEMISLVDALAAPMSLITALIVALAQRREKELAKTFSDLERIWDEYEVYERIDN